MRYRKVRISAELLFQLFAAGRHAMEYSVIEDAIPEDAQLVNVQHSWPNGIELLIRSDSFSEVKLSEQIPTLSPTLRKSK